MGKLCFKTVYFYQLFHLLSSHNYHLYASTKKHSHHLKVDLFYLVEMFRTQSLGDSLGVALRKLLQIGRGEVRLHTSLQQREQKVWTSKIRYQVRNLAFYEREDASLWDHWIHSFHMHLSSLEPILFPCAPCFLHSPSSSAITMEGGSICCIPIWGTLIHIWRPEIADDCDISCWLIWQ